MSLMNLAKGKGSLGQTPSKLAHMSTGADHSRLKHTETKMTPKASASGNFHSRAHIRQPHTKASRIGHAPKVRKPRMK